MIEHEHPVEQPIRSVVATPDSNPEVYTVGRAGVTRIEATVKSGLYSNIPYIRVWAGDKALAEFCQHNVSAVYFDPAVIETKPEE